MLKKIAIGILLALVIVASLVMVTSADEPDTDLSPRAPMSRWPGSRRSSLGSRRGDAVRGAPGPFGRLDILTDVLGMTPQEISEAVAGGETVATLAAEKGIDLAEIITEFVNRPLPSIAGRLSKAIENGDLTQQEADERLDNMQERLGEMLAKGMSPAFGPGHGVRPDGGHHEALSDVLGLSPEEIHEALADGQTMTAIIESQGLKLDEVVDALAEPFAERWAQAVEDGEMTPELAAERLEQFRERAVEQLTTASGDRPQKPGRPARMGGAFGFQGMKGSRGQLR